MLYISIIYCVCVQEVTESNELILMYRFYYHMNLERCVLITYHSCVGSLHAVKNS